MTTAYIIRAFDSQTAIIAVEYQSDKSLVNILLQLDENGVAPTGEALDTFVMQFQPQPAHQRPVSNAAEIEALVQPLPDNVTWDQIRAIRNNLLSGCDWTQLPDVSLTTEKVAEWAAYRQQLREVTTAFPTPNDVVWPTPPA